MYKCRQQGISSLLMSKQGLYSWKCARQDPALHSINHGVATQHTKSSADPMATENVAAAWEKIKAPTLVIYGEYDWIMSRKDHEAMAAAVNTNNKGAGTLIVIPKMGHSFTVHPTLKDSFNDTNGVYATELSEQVLKWLKNN